MKVKKRIRKLVLLLCTVLICSMANGEGVMAKYVNGIGWGPQTQFVDSDMLEEGDIISIARGKTRLRTPSDYTVVVNGNVVSGNSVIEINDYNKEDLDNTGYIYVESCVKDEEKKTIDIVWSERFQVSIDGRDGIYVKPGTEITLTASIPKEYQPYFTKFGHWTIYKYEELGLSEEDLTQMSIHFIIPARNVGAGYDYYINTISGNVLRSSYQRLYPEFLGDISDIETSIKESGGEEQRKETADSSAAETIGGDVISGIVQTADGRVLTSDVPVHFVAGSITGAVSVASADTVNNLAGINDEESREGTKAKFYIGDVYRPEVRKSLREAAGEKGNMIGMLDIDLYTIGKNGIQAVRNVGEPIRMVIGLPQNKQSAERTYSLIYVNNGKVMKVEDKDNDIKTITVDLDYFGAYAIVFE